MDDRVTNQPREKRGNVRNMLNIALSSSILRANRLYMKRIAVSLILLFAVIHPVFGALKVSLVTDPELGRATKHGLEELRQALQARGIQIEDAKEPSAATGDVVVVAGDEPHRSS